jgi:hypothetical protein
MKTFKLLAGSLKIKKDCLRASIVKKITPSKLAFPDFSNFNQFSLLREWYAFFNYLLKSFSGSGRNANSSGNAAHHLPCY